MKGVEGVGQKCAENSMAQILGVNFKESATHERQVGRMSGRGSCGKGARQKDGKSGRHKPLGCGRGGRENVVVRELSAMVSRCIWQRSSGVKVEIWDMVAQPSLEDIGQTGQSRTVREAGREGLHGYLQHPPTSTNMPDSKKGDSATVRRAGGLPLVDIDVQISFAHAICSCQPLCWYDFPFQILSDKVR